MAVCQVQVIPLGTGSPGVSEYVADAVEMLRREFPDLVFKLTPMATVIEGDLGRLFYAIEKMHRAPFAKGVKRVVTSITIDDRVDKELTMEGKVASVLDKIGD